MQARASRWLLFYPATYARGERVRHFLALYRKSQHWPIERIRQLQLERVRFLVDLALRNSRLYAERYRAAGLTNARDIRGLDDMAALPHLTKQDLVEHTAAVRVKQSVFSTPKTTGGSTGEPVTVHKNPEALARERAATWRCYEWTGIEVGASQARLWGLPHTQSGRFKAAVTDVFANRRRISAFDLDRDSLVRYHDVLMRFRPEFIYGYASALEKYAATISELRLPSIDSLKSAISTSEVLTEGARAQIEAGFGVQCFNEYGCGEVGSIAHECEHRRLHLMAENLYVESAGESGEALVVTDLFNEHTPLIRYRIGDSGKIGYEACDCGRTLPILEKVYGRAYDIVITTAGRHVHPEALIYVFEDLQRGARVARQFQIVQKSLDKLEIRIVKGSAWDDSYVQALETGLDKALGERMHCDFLFVDEIEREASGKMRVVKSEVPRS